MSEKLNRRQAIATAIGGIGAFAFGGILWGGFIGKAKASNFSLRPPGAVNEEDFLKLCIKCGKCVSLCPFDTLKLADFGDDVPIGTPFFTPREIPCYMCTDVPCVPECPTKALDPKLLSIEENGKEMMDIRKAQMGVAVVDKKACVAFWGIRCDACYRDCPLLGEALRLEYKNNDRTNKHAIIMPVVDSDICTGCGLCEKACITQKSAITILPRDKVLGSVNNDYIKSWDKADEGRIDPSKNRDMPLDGAIDYLNKGGEL